MANDKVVTLTRDNFETAVRKYEKPVLVDFWAEWCGPCRMLAPIIDELANDYDGRAGICKLNVDNEGAIAAEFGVMSIPTMLIFRQGELKERLVGLRPKEEITEIIDKYLDS